MTELHTTAQALLADYKGLLAADESSKSAKKRFDALNIPCDEESRRQYRQMLITTPGIEQYLSGVIFYDETLRQNTDDGTAFVKHLADKGVISGIKVDKGLVDLDNFKDETITEGLDGLTDRLKEYYELGARFAKWRAAFPISDKTPSQTSLHANLHTMARYASMCQTAKIVPIVEPEVLYDGSHNIEESRKTTESTIRLLIQMLQAYRVDLNGCILKTSMVLAGKASQTASTPQEVAENTLAMLNETVPKNMAGVVFLSGGQTTEQARNNLQAIGTSGEQPWPITFSFSRAVQDMPMKTWAGKSENVEAAQKQYLELTKLCALARHGEYHGDQNESNDSFVSTSQDS